MFNANTRKKLKDCTIAALVFYILAFIFSFVASILAYTNLEYYDSYYYYSYDYGGYRYGYHSVFDDEAYIGAIMETVAFILLIAIIILCIAMIRTKESKKYKGLAGAIVGISCPVFVFSMVGLMYLLWSYCGVAWILSMIAFIMTFVALIMSIVCLVIVTKKHKSEDVIINNQMPRTNIINNSLLPRTDALIFALREYKELHDSGLLTDEEYSVQKAKILEQLEM